MASLMQAFAEARQQRLQERKNFVGACQQASEDRAKEFQEQAAATAKYLAHAEQNRLAWDLGRQAIAENALAARQEELQNRADQISEYLQVLNTTRIQTAATDSEERAQEVRTRTFKTQSQLKHIHKARVRDGNSARLERQRITQERAALTEMQIEDINKARLASAAVDAQQRAAEVEARTEEMIAKLQAISSQRLSEAKQDAELRAQGFSDRVADVKSSLAEINANRLAEAEAQAQKLSDFRADLRAAVWSGDRTVAKPVEPVSVKPAKSKAVVAPVEKPSKLKKVATPPIEAKAPEAPKPIEVKETPKEVVKSASKIEQFVVDYVSQLSTNSSLLEVVNDRDTVRDLLAQGANTLKVDPSDILNTLLQMAEAS
ncbi:hypothetical protein HCU40_12655 [Pseudanabaena biceps]|nr:hypothetical protein [Pseudanabaena biceps]